MASPGKVQARVIKVFKHTDTVASYQLEPLGRVPKFHPGQFLHLTLSAYSSDQPWPESRVFSIASSPTERTTRLDITISVKGVYTKKIYDERAEGDRCWLKLPYGEFLFSADHRLILVAGGVGMTPFISRLKTMIEEQSNQAVILYYGIRSRAHFLFGDLISLCEERLPCFTSHIYCEDGTVPGTKGMLDIAAIAASATTGELVYLSGPPAMIQTFSTRLNQFGIAGERVRIDNWE